MSSNVSQIYDFVWNTFQNTIKVYKLQFFVSFVFHRVHICPESHLAASLHSLHAAYGPKAQSCCLPHHFSCFRSTSAGWGGGGGGKSIYFLLNLYLTDWLHFKLGLIHTGWLRKHNGTVGVREDKALTSRVYWLGQCVCLSVQVCVCVLFQVCIYF